MSANNILASIRLHPNDQDAESVIAYISLSNRSLSLCLDFNSYGNHYTKSYVYFNKPEDMINLGKKMIEIAEKAQEYFKENL